MRTEDCRPWREEIGALVLGRLEEERRLPLLAHLETCADCRAEADELAPVAALLPAADPHMLDAVPVPPPHLEGLVVERVRAARGRGRQRRGARLLGAAAAAVLVTALAAALAAAFVGPGEPSDRVTFRTLMPGVRASGVVEPRSSGMRIELHATGLEAGRPFQVWCERPDGAAQPAGSFLGSASGMTDAVLTSAVPYAQWNVVRVEAADGRTVLIARKHGS